MRLLYQTHFIFILFLAGFFISKIYVEPKNICEEPAKLIVKIIPVFNNKPLRLHTGFYGNQNGDSLFVNEFKFYISNISFQTVNNKVYSEPNSIHLFDANDSTSFLFAIPNIENGDYVSINLSLGLDSIYCAWNNGCVSAKLAGQSRQCNTLHHKFEFDIGGYLTPFNTLRNVSLVLPLLQIKNNRNSFVEIYADAAEWFRTPQIIQLAKTNSIVIPGKQAVMMADNYMNMLKIHNIYYYWEEQ